MKRIDSIKNERIKAWKKLHTRKGREKAGMFMVEGHHLIEEALKSPIVVQVVLMTEEIVAPSNELINGCEMIVVSDQVMKEISETESPQGIAAICELPVSPAIDTLEGRYLLADRVQDPGNLGTMIRTADAAGMTGVVLGEGSVDLFNSKVIRSSQGSIFHLPVVKGDLLVWIQWLKEAGIPVFGTALEGASSYSAIEPQEQFALIVGNEGEGVSQEILDRTDQNLYVPIYGHAESLNVAVATGVLLYYLRG
ncbi:TrmH family RNA methyltransferase [Bacillus suaedae]|uniref:RNA methyltransferase n=1 Tax=Halalkalibacter suaedae TaxID=2822140 RepID=A0A940WX07_9BACI|nr:RNA methyltransferase [Bacillus suaedae]MBP3949716.1 RNA methyltransferase [Bacillus suaedae]